MRPLPNPARKCLDLRSLLANRTTTTATTTTPTSHPLSQRWLASIAAGQKARLSTAPSSASTPFFLQNRLFERTFCLDNVTSASTTNARRTSSTTTTASIPRNEPDSEHDSTEISSQLAPHRRRQARKSAQDATSLPPDASSILSATAAAQPSRSLRRSFAAFLALSKPRLGALIVLTAMASYSLYPVPEMLGPLATATPSLSPLTLFFLTTGTASCIASANALNMLYETKSDAKMSRTRNRPLVRNLITTRSAVVFAVMTGVVGVGSLYFGVNPTVSFLGLANIVLYAGVYTPLKRITTFNTWVGAVVGGIPPLMGWAAAAGETATRDGSWKELLLAADGSSIGGWLMASLLVAWQFPHFMALSWGIREEYKAAGLRMLAWTNPARNARVALRYSLSFIPICVCLCAAGVTDWSFAVTSLPINLWLAREAVRFWKFEGHKGSARGLFWASVWHLPGVMILAMLHKNGMWTRVWRSVFGQEEGEWEEEELEEMASMTAAKVAEKIGEPTTNSG